MASDFKFLNMLNDGICISVKIVPNSSCSKVVDYTDDFLKVKISSPPIDNRANRALVNFFSDLLSVNKSKIKIISGEKSKLKKILISDTKLDFIIQKIMFVLDSESKNK